MLGDVDAEAPGPAECLPRLIGLPHGVQVDILGPASRLRWDLAPGARAEDRLPLPRGQRGAEPRNEAAERLDGVRRELWADPPGAAQLGPGAVLGVVGQQQHGPAAGPLG